MKPIDRISFRAKIAACATVLIALSATSRSLADEASNHSATNAPRFKPLVSKETTYLTEPLTADGRVDYVAALNVRYGQNIKPQDNAAIALWQLSPEEITPEFKEKFYQLVGRLPPDKDGPKLKELNRFDPFDEQSVRMHEELVDQFRVSQTRPWSAAEFPRIAAYLRKNNRALAIASEASQLPGWFLPMIPGKAGTVLSRQMTGVAVGREVARLLVSRAMLRLHDHKFNAAWNDLLAAIRLARLHSHGVEYIEFVLSTAMEGMAIQGFKQYLQHAPLSHKESVASQNELANLKQRCSYVENCVLTMRLSMLDSITNELACGDIHNTLRQLDASPVMFAVAQDIDWNETLRECNRWFDRYAAVLQNDRLRDRLAARKDFSQQMTLLETKQKNPLKLLEELGKSHDLPQTKGKLMAEFLLPIFLYELADAPAGSDDKIRQEFDLLLLGFRLAAYRADQGNYPNSLADLMAADSQAIPIDRFTGNDLTYRTANGGYLLYSFGPNGEDNGGRTAAQRTETGDPQADDITVKIEKRD
jgi:hypothetical protein